eukprot:scaffold1029_cov194-Amphora_coffeaeformis.AAC.4
MSRRIQALNNTGIKSLESGFFSEAICSFRMAMECLNANLHPSGNSSVAEYLELPAFPMDVACIDTTTILDASPHNSFDVYQTAFAFPKMSSLASFQTEVSVVLFYNLALAHHLAGLAGAEESEMHLHQAQKFYKIGMTIFKSTPGLRVDTSCFSMVLGMLTNLGHIFTHFFNPKDAASCRSHMQEILQSAAVMGLSDEDGEFFYSALTHSQSHDAVAAPAA